jgi:DNA polymerase-3 subunit alpha
MHRAQFFYAPPTDPINGLERLVRFGNQFQASSSVSFNSLFGDTAMPEVKPPLIPDCEKWALPELLDREKDVVGIYLSAHPLDGFKFEMENYGMTPLSELEANKGRNIRIAGYVSDVGHLTSKKGTKFGKLTINDYSGNYEIMLWEKSYVQYGNFLVNGQKLMIQCIYDEHKYRPGTMELQIQNMMLLDEVRKVHTKRLTISLPLLRVDQAFVEFIEHNVKTHPGSTELLIRIIDWNGMEVKLKSQNRKIEVSDALIKYLQDNEEDIKYSLEKT